MSLFVFATCKNNPTTPNSKIEATQSNLETNFACPMHPEKTGKSNDKCSKCGMNLEPAKVAATKKFTMTFQIKPVDLEAGKAGTLSFKPEIEGVENASVPLDLHHEKKIHLIAVSKDLAWFEHIHPEYQADGSYQINVLAAGQNFTNGRGKNETTFERGGDYVLFADYMPTGAPGQLQRIPVSIGGTPYKPVVFLKEKWTSTVGGYSISLKPGSGKFVTNNTLHIEGVISKAGKIVPAESFENYLGAKAHVVMIGIGAENYMHVHPEVAEGKLDLHATFEKAGIYRGWLQFQTDGKLHTADFVIDVKEGKVGEVPNDQGHGESDHKH
jgi:Heavy metal binding domain